MTHTTKPQLTLQEFLASPHSESRSEFIHGEVVPKVSPKRFHSQTQSELLVLLKIWGDSKGEVGVEWSVTLQRQGEDWIPVPDLLFVFNAKLPDTLGNDPCPVAPDLVVEIISPGQRFGEMTEKALDYLNAGVGRVWILDPETQSITVFAADTIPKLYRGDSPLTDSMFPGLEVTASKIFAKISRSKNSIPKSDPRSSENQIIE